MPHLSLTQTPDPTYDMALTAVQACEDRKGGNIVLLDMQGVSILADYFLIVTGYSHTQVRAIARAVEEQMYEQWQLHPQRVEGMQTGSWILMDFADILVHVLLEEQREYYDLDTFWGAATRVQIPMAG